MALFPAKHWDVDVFDPSTMPGVNLPEPGGLNSRDILEIFHALQSTGKVKVVDLTGYNPLGTGTIGEVSAP